MQERLNQRWTTWKQQQRDRPRPANRHLPFLLASAVALTGGLALTNYRTVHDLILAQLKQKAILEVQNGSNKIDQWLAVRRAEVEMLANSTALRSLDQTTVGTQLNAERDRLRDFFAFALLKRDGTLWHTNLGYAPRPQTLPLPAHQTEVSDPFVVPYSGHTLIAIATPIRAASNPNQFTLGILDSNLRIEYIQHVVEQLTYGEGSYAFALNSKGTTIGSPKATWMTSAKQPTTTVLNAPNPHLAQIAQRMVNRDRNIALLTLDGQEQYIAYVPLRQANWSVGLVIPRNNLESQLIGLNLLALTLAALPVLAGFVIAHQAHLSAKSKAQIELLQAQEKELQQSEAQLRQQTDELHHTLRELRTTQAQLIQSEKMSGLGQLVAGVAHEINNPVNFIYGNLTHANHYTEALIHLLAHYQRHYPHPPAAITTEIEAIDLDFLVEDLPKLLQSMRVGADRIKTIVASLRNFSRMDEAEMKTVDVHDGIDSTLMILQHRLKPQGNGPGIQVIKYYGVLPPVECYAGQLNQVFMNLLTNAADALEDAPVATEAEPITSWREPTITIRTRSLNATWVQVVIADNGCGIAPAVQARLFDPFFTTKPVGKGTGLGLSISYDIVTQKHRGRLECRSTPQVGTEFVIEIPIAQTVSVVA